MLPNLKQHGVEKVTITGVACTDIGYLFEEIVQAIHSGVHFRVLMVNPDSKKDIDILKMWENNNDVAEKVQKPLKERLEKLATNYESRKAETASRLRELASQLQTNGFIDHSTCIKVCAEVWCLADAEAKARDSFHTKGDVSFYHLKELPFVRYWVFDDKDVRYSVYGGRPGVGIGTESAVFCYSSLSGSEPHGLAAKRAAHYIETLIKACDDSVKVC